MQKILYVEDDLSLIDGLQYTLENSGYAVDNARTVKEALSLFRSNHYDLLLLDVTLPDGTGFDVCKEVRSSSTIPIIFLTASDQEISIVKGLDMGGDDYITKPFSISELIARVDAVCRRVNRSGSKPEEASQIVSGPFTLNLKSRTVFKNGEQIDLTQVEYQIMEYFFKNQNTALDRSSILNHIWGESYYGDDKIVDVNIRRIRMKIEDEPSNPKYISTIWGFGYKWSGDGNPDDDKK